MAGFIYRVKGFEAKTTISLVLLALLASIFCFSQSLPSDSLAKQIKPKLLVHGYYSVFEGLPWMYQEGVEIPGTTDLDRRIRIDKDTTFDEVVFKEWQNEAIETCLLPKDKPYFIQFYSGKWAIKSDTIFLNYTTKRVYREMKFSNCFYYSKFNKFQCDTAPVCTFPFLFERKFIFKNEELHEIGNYQYIYN